MCAACALWAAALGAQGAPSRLDAVRARDTLRVGVARSLPWVMEDPDRGLYGFDVDLARRLAGSLGVEAAFVVDSLGGLAYGVRDGRYDLGMAGLNVTPERLALVDFSRPHSQVRVALLPRRDRDGIRSFREADREGVLIGVLAGSSAEPLLDAIVRRATLRRYDGELALFLALRDAEVDAAIVYGEQAGMARRAFPDLVADRDVVVSLGGEAVALPKGDGAFRDEVNQLIQALVRDGWIGERRAYWFDPDQRWARGVP